MKSTFYNLGQKTSDIEVRISYRIIQLFSEGLYSSPHKAIEELVSNAFDAGATNVHVILPPDLMADGATITVIDDGTGMDQSGLTEHWLIGVTRKRDRDVKLPKGRKQIGKFGIGKLATYVLGNRLTHISKVGSSYFSTSMDYSKIPTGEGGGIHTEEKVLLPLRRLTEKEAKDAVGSLVDGSKPGYKAIKLFGPGAAKSWTVAIMSDLKDMASEIQRGRLRWILQTAMPLRDDFNLFLNGDRVPPSKLTAKKVGHWVLGKDLKEIPKPAPENLEVSEDPKAQNEHRYGLTHPELGRITGYAEIFEDPLDTGKSTELERSHGFFVYVRGRLVNIDDAGFGISRNLLRHGTFSRFRMVVNIDHLDDELRSSRETLREGPLFNVAQNILHGVFNFARVALEKHQTEESKEERISYRIAASPGSLTRRPIIGLVQAAIQGKASPKYIAYPQKLTGAEETAFLAGLEAKAETVEGLVRDVQLLEMSQDEGLTILDVETGVLKINTFHPFVAHFLDEYEDKKRSLPLELLAMSEVLLEAYLYEIGLDEDKIRDVMSRRDEGLRYLARSTGKRNARTIAQDLVDAASDDDALEKALVAAADSVGFDAVPLGGKGKPDGRAEARLAGDSSGPRRYAVSLEAKSKEKEGAKVSAKSVGISTITRQRDEYNCDHALVVGPDFPTSEGEKSALVKEITKDREATGKTVTLIRILDLARLVRLVPLKRIGLGRLRELFTSCTTPEESKAWVDKVAAESVPKVPYKVILDAIWDLQKERPDEAVEYSGLAVALQKGPKALKMPKSELQEICKAISRMAPEMISARKNSVELSQKPESVMALIGSAIQEYPEEETKGVQFK